MKIMHCQKTDIMSPDVMASTAAVMKRIQAKISDAALQIDSGSKISQLIKGFWHDDASSFIPVILWICQLNKDVHVARFLNICRYRNDARRHYHG